MSAAHRILLLFLLAPLSGCSGATALEKHQLEEMRRDLDSIKLSNERLQERITNLETASASSSSPRQSTSHRESRDERPRDLEVVHLGPEQDPPQRNGIAMAEDDGEPPTVIRVEGNRTPVVSRGSIAPTGPSDSQAANDYDRALQLVKKKQYEQALEQLTGFLVRYPGHASANSAMYWRGECYYAMGNFVRAAEQFEGVVARFPRGESTPDALLKLGMSQRRMGESDKAAKSFSLLRINYPYSEAVLQIPRE
jgi:tol-pal system protein YbgF